MNLMLNGNKFEISTQAPGAKNNLFNICSQIKFLGSSIKNGTYKVRGLNEDFVIAVDNKSITVKEYEAYGSYHNVDFNLKVRINRSLLNQNW